jgi:predicted permease
MMRRWERIALRLLPRADRARFGADLCRDWQDLRRSARAEGRLAAWRYQWRECRAFIRLVRERRALARGHRPVSGNVRMDVRTALRLLRRRPLRSLVTATILAIAFTSALVAFGVADAILWRSLPFSNPDRLVVVWEQTGQAGNQGVARITGSRLADWRTSATVFEGLAAFGAAGFLLESPEGVTTVRGVRVTGDFFDVLGVAPLHGRLLQPADQAAGALPVVVLSHAYWQSRMGARPEVVGEQLLLSGRSHTIVGVLPDVWLPAWPVNPATIMLAPDYRQLFVTMPPDSVLADNRRSHVLGGIGRLRAGETPETATTHLAALSGPEWSEPHSGVVRPLRESLVRENRAALLVLLAAAFCVWLVACLNLAALEVAGFETRRDEFLTRAALGASVWTLSRQVLVEAVPTVVCALLMAVGATHVILQALPAALGADIPFVTMPRLDGAAIGVLAALAVAAMVTMTVWPVVRVRALGRLADGGAVRVMSSNLEGFRALIAGQVAGAVALLVVTVLLLQSFIAVTRRDAGFDPSDVRAIEINLSGDRFADPAALVDVEQRLIARLEAEAWISAVAVSHDHPFEANWLDGAVLIGGTPDDRTDLRQQAQLRIVSPEYVTAMRTRLVEGRALDPAFGLGDDGIVLVNEAFVRMTGAGLGRQVRLGSPRGTYGARVPSEFSIVGIVVDERFRGLELESEPAVYVSTRQFPQHDFNLLVRPAAGQSARVGQLRGIVASVEPRASVGAPRALEDLEAALRTTRTLTTFVTAGFAAGALGLAATGLYGMLTLLVAGRRREIGVRLALGAGPRRVVAGILRMATTPVAAGVVVGLALAWFAVRAVSAMLVAGGDVAPRSVAIVVIVMALTTMGAVLLPARRAARIDPATTLRQ